MAPVYKLFYSLEDPDAIYTIRTFTASDHFIARMDAALGRVSSVSWHRRLSFAMMGFQFGILSALSLSLTAATSCLVPGIDAGAMAMSLQLVARAAGGVSSLLGQVADIEGGMRSVERVAEYSTGLPTEPECGTHAPESWPTEGKIEVHRLTVGYGDGETVAPVLKEVSFTVGAGERVGIVGRTGAGKSSLTLAFLRLLRLLEGEIVIDGIDVASLKLRELRRRVFVIPQDPYIFGGPIRSTVDPYNTLDDMELISLLQSVRFKIQPKSLDEEEMSTVASEWLDLSFVITEGGRNLSQGQRQILYLAKALVARPKLVVMDEATSSIDQDADAAIQETLRRRLPDSTVIVVAHRLATVVDFDKILVLGNGELVECGSPAELYARQGCFWKLVYQSADRDRLLMSIVDRGRKRSN
jgi:ABC-type multidrug transport system fused ATPase/permease subunit